MSDQFDPREPPFIKGKFSAKKSAKLTGATTGGITGFTIAANYLAPMVIEYMNRWEVPIPAELSVGIMAGGIAGALAFAFDVARFRGWLDWTKRS